MNWNDQDELRAEAARLAREEYDEQRADADPCTATLVHGSLASEWGCELEAGHDGPHVSHKDGIKFTDNDNDNDNDNDES